MWHLKQGYKGGGGEKFAYIALHPFMSKKIKNSCPFPPQKMSASPPTISMSDKEDACICKHKVGIEKAKHAKEEQQRQWEEEAWRAAEAERVWREVEAEKVWRDMEAKEAWRTAEVEEAWRKAKDNKSTQKEAEKVWAEVEKQKKVEVSAAWRK